MIQLNGDSRLKDTCDSPSILLLRERVPLTMPVRGTELSVASSCHGTQSRVSAVMSVNVRYVLSWSFKKEKRNK